LKKFKDLFGRRAKILPQVVPFHSKYQIEAMDEESTDYELNESFLDMISTRKGIRVEGEGNYLLVYRKNKQISANEILLEYEFAIGLVESLIYDKSNEYV